MLSSITAACIVFSFAFAICAFVALQSIYTTSQPTTQEKEKLGFQNFSRKYRDAKKNNNNTHRRRNPSSSHPPRTRTRSLHLRNPHLTHVRIRLYLQLPALLTHPHQLNLNLAHLLAPGHEFLAKGHHVVCTHCIVEVGLQSGREQVAYEAALAGLLGLDVRQESGSGRL